MFGRQGQAIDRFTTPEHVGENFERSTGKGRREIFYFETQAEVRFVRAEAVHRFFIRHSRKWPEYRDAECIFVNRSHHALGNLNNILRLWPGHLDIYLAELRLAVGAQIFVPKASCYLVIAIEAGDH